CPVFGYQGKILRSSCKNNTGGFEVSLVAGKTTEIGYCEVGPIYGSFWGPQHDNGILCYGGLNVGPGSNSALKIYNTKVHDTNEACLLLSTAGVPTYVYNCLIYNSNGRSPIKYDPGTGNGANCYTFNNTLVSGSPGVR